MCKTSIKSSTLYKQATESAKQLANKNMVKCGRKNWNEEDYEVFQKSFFMLLKTHAGYEVVNG